MSKLLFILLGTENHEFASFGDFDFATGGFGDNHIGFRVHDGSLGVGEGGEHVSVGGLDSQEVGVGGSHSSLELVSLGFDFIGDVQKVVFHLRFII